MIWTYIALAYLAGVATPFLALKAIITWDERHDSEEGYNP